MGIPQRALGDDERVVLAVRPHGRVLVGPVVVLFVLAPVTGVVAGFVSPGGAGSVLRAVVLVLGGVVVFRGAVVPFLLWRSTVYTVTTQRVAVRRGVLSRFGRDVPLARVSGVTFRTGPLDRLFGSGRIRIDATGEGPLVLDDVPAVEHVQRAVQKYAGLAADELPDDSTDEPTDDLPAYPADPDDGPFGHDLLDVEELDEPFEVDGSDEDLGDEGFGDESFGDEDQELEDEELEDDDGDEDVGGGDDGVHEVDDVTWRRRGRGGWWRR
ncbi:PH domain-containing protein [Kineosporia sp. R_H_3]|uniref:PH domain-containing protein n=1 Tax=Kineosporia sp. R_H_3 TaxID=1961848 RepID=UPI000B4BE8DA|nr:PH domain-containing protein [Kineosporia sp. R_H_3]